MNNQKKIPMKYKRDKNGVEISGDADEIKGIVWLDQISHRLIWVALAIVLLCVLPQASWLPLLWYWLKRQLVMLILLPVGEDFLGLLLSG